MKERKRTAAKNILRGAAILLTGIAAGLLLLACVYAIPQSAMRGNTEKSIGILHKETVYPYALDEIRATQLDNFTDALMLNETYYKGGSFAEDMLSSVHICKDGAADNTVEAFYDYMTGAEGEYYEESYGRYWHGYQVVLAPLLTVFNISSIRFLNMAVQLVLVAAVLLALYARGRRDMLIPYGLMWLSLIPVTLFYSLQFSSTFYVMVLLSLLIAVKSERLSFAKLCFSFEIAGILEAYFDFLTYPLVAFGVPVILWFALDAEKRQPLRRRIGQLVKLGVSWVCGYLGMWSSKWIIAALFAKDNTLATAIGSVKFRSSMQIGDTAISYLDVLKANVVHYMFRGFAVLFAAGILLWLVQWIRQRKRGAAPDLHGILPVMGIVAVCALMPFGWYFAVGNHSYLHSWFTFRELSIFFYGGFTIPYLYLHFCREKSK